MQRRLCLPCVWLPYLRRHAAYFAALPLPHCDIHKTAQLLLQLGSAATLVRFVRSV
jgi:hypothetical protein